jgi:hypothetical protein
VTHTVTDAHTRIYPTEVEAALDFDAILRSLDLFTSYAEVPAPCCNPDPVRSTRASASTESLSRPLDLSTPAGVAASSASRSRRPPAMGAL